MIQEDVLIIDQENISDRFFKITLKSNYITSKAKPGQFVNIKVSNTTDPLLRRPISIHKIIRESQTFELLYEVVGKGTVLLSQKTSLETINILGPLGNGFSLTKRPKETAILVGGGIGIAPLYALAEKITKKTYRSVHVLIGAKTKSFILCESDFKNLGADVFISTEDGSYGKKGLITQTLDNLIHDLNLKNVDIFSCGPYPMLKSISEIADKHKSKCQMSFEANMACGIGACKGCAIKTNSGYKMVCKDGPIFDAKEINWG